MESHKFCVGETFESYEHLNEKLENFTKHEFVQLWKVDSRKLEKAVASGRLSKSREYNKELIYYELKLACVHGGTEFHSEATGKRSSSYVFS